MDCIQGWARYRSGEAGRLLRYKARARSLCCSLGEHSIAKAETSFYVCDADKGLLGTSSEEQIFEFL